jgi:hypothetical protein
MDCSNRFHRPEQQTVGSNQESQRKPNQQACEPVQEDRSAPLLARVEARGVPSTVRINGTSGDVRVAVVSLRHKKRFRVGSRIQL